MSPTVFREGPWRFFFFSREEARLHIHVQSADGEAKYWLAPSIAHRKRTPQDCSNSWGFVLTDGGPGGVKVLRWYFELGPCAGPDDAQRGR